LVYSVSDGCVLGSLALWVVTVYFYADVADSHLFHSTCFVVPDGCIVLVQFCFDILVFVYLLCLISSAEFYILLTVHPEEIVDFNQLEALCSLFFNVFILSPLHVSSDKALIIRREQIVLTHPLVQHTGNKIN
jgi:hypothetical protein